MRTEDDAEQRALQYLRYLGFTNIEYQPEGTSKFPDFLVDGRIVVEVRRLNISAVDANGKLINNKAKGQSVRRRIRQLLPTLGAPIAGTSWFVRARFKRPLMQWGKLRVAIERKLLVFQADPQDKAVMRIHDNFELELHRARRTYEHCFLDGAYDDLDNAGYFVDYERQRNLKLCIGSKTNKRIRAALKRHYSEWWLIFDDQIGYGTAFDFPDQMDIDYDWNKVILLNPTGPTMAYELPTSRDLK